MPKVMLIAGMAKSIPDFDGDLIGVDRGAYLCYKSGKKMRLAIGDFDSISEDQLQAIAQTCELIQLPAHKNETDSEMAIRKAMELNYDEIILYGGLGGRLDHELVNLRMMLYHYPIQLMNENNRCSYIKEGIYHIKKEYKYLSFIPMEDSVISECGVAYPLSKQNIRLDDLYTTSNEILEEAEITVHSGSFIMIECND